jgi:thiosulfate reductase cytochrome b subunit
MTIEATSHPDLAPAAAATGMIHPLWVRVTHWINAVAVLVMIGSGWEIYNASPLFPFGFPRAITLGGWLAGALLWHFAAMWVLAVNGLIYVALGIATGRFRKKLLPIRPSDVIADASAALKGKLSHDDLSVYNAVQKLLYLGVIIAGVVIALSGLAIWKPVQLSVLTAMFGGFVWARYWHFLAMLALVALSIGHIFMVFAVDPYSLRAIVTGGYDPSKSPEARNARPFVNLRKKP